MITKRLDATIYLLKQKRIPPSLVIKDTSKALSYDNVVDVFAKLPTEYKDKIKYYFSELYGKSIVITGDDSLLKDEIAIAILIIYACMNRKVYYYASPEDFDGNLGYANAFMRVDHSNKNLKLIPALTSALLDRKVIILSANNLKSLTDSLGTDVINLLFREEVVEIASSVKREKNFIKL